MPAAARIAVLLFGSGLCALIYQVAWLRELRLVFGASTPASAAVLAVFMGGLGYGSLKLGRRADSAPRPLLLYSQLELGVAATAAVTPLLLWGARHVYVLLGGTTALGMGAGTVVRLLLSALVLLPPTFLMGGTLPAAARAAIVGPDVGRRSTALLYGANTLGAVAGATLTTFLMLEVFGTRITLWLGCLLNGLVGMSARFVDRGLPKVVSPEAVAADTSARALEGAAEEERGGEATPPLGFVLLAAGAVGFVFLLLELVWYRMLAPLLGGTTYTFGLILAVALFGVGVGGILYTLRSNDRSPTLASFALTCGLEALLVTVPFALGDRLALLAALLRPFGAVGLVGHALAWTTITSLVVLPAALVAGYQFPMLIALLGAGRRDVGRHVGLAYASNTLGAIGGSLAGGFLLLPTLGATGSWKGCAWALAALGIVALLLHARPRPMQRALPIAAAVLTAGFLLTSVGPTAVWRHTPIGAGRSDFVARSRSRNELRRWMRQQRYATWWQSDGRESSVAMATLRDTAFVVNGKSDGSAVIDATTQVMSGLLGALLHQEVHRPMVVGLGTGSTAGWLGKLPQAEVVDVVEIEPDIVEVARVCAPVNGDVLDNPKVKITYGDAREVLLTSPYEYDLVFSEPSNPYRAGIASLFTREFYEAVHSRLRPGGIFVQWVQGYEIDAEAVRTVYATLSSVFGSVSTWRTDVNDLMLLASDEELVVDVARLRSRIAEEPFASALMAAWRVNTVEGVLAHHVASPELARAVAGTAGPLQVNTDDRNLLEFAVARSLGRDTRYSVEELRQLAEDRGWARPALRGGEVDWAAVSDARMTLAMAQDGTPPNIDSAATPEAEHRYRALAAWARGDVELAMIAWGSQPREPRTPVELMVMADSAATLGREQAEGWIERLAEVQPVEAMAIRARLLISQGDPRGAFEQVQRAFETYRHDPWPSNALMVRTMALVVGLAQSEPALLEPLMALLAEPFAVNVLRIDRELTFFELSLMHADHQRCVAALAPLEPNTPWDRGFLVKRYTCYELAQHPWAARAQAELALFDADSGTPVSDLVPAAP